MDLQHEFADGNDQEKQVGNVSGFAIRYVDRVDNYKRGILVFWGVMFLLGGYFAQQFMGVVILIYEPPKGTPGEIAVARFNNQYPSASHETDTILLLSTLDGSPILDFSNETKPFISNLTARVVKWGRERAEPETIFQPISYFFLSELGAKASANALLSNSSHPQAAQGMIATIHLKSGFEQGSQMGNKFVDWLLKEMDSLSKIFLSPNVKAEATGMLVFCRDMQETSEEDMLKMDSLSFPFALLVLAFMLKSARLLILPVINMVLTVAVSFMLMYPVAVSTNVIAVAPSVMMSCSVAFSIDYSLFLLSRFREEILRGCTVKEAVVLMIDSAGHTIMVSGATIAICWFGLVMIPVTLLSTIGLGSGLTVVVTFVVNITLTPAMLLMFGPFFSCFENYGLKNCCGRHAEQTETSLDARGTTDQPSDSLLGVQRRHSALTRSETSPVASALESPCTFDAFGRRPVVGSARSSSMINCVDIPPVNLDTMSSPRIRSPSLNSNGCVDGEITSPLFGMVDPVAEITFLKEHSIWYKVGVKFFGTPLRALSSVIVVSACIFPLTPWAISFHHSESPKLFTPTDAVSAVTANHMETLFGGGRLAPYELLIYPKEGTKVLSNEFFFHIQDVVEDVLVNLEFGHSVKALNPQDVMGMMMMNGVNVSFISPNLLTPSIAGCASLAFSDFASYYLSVCAHEKCDSELDRCSHDEACSHELDCLKGCAGNPWCAGACFAHVTDLDHAAWTLGKCIMNECIRDVNLTSSFGPVHANSTDMVAGRDISERTNSPDCASIMLQFLQSVNGFIPESTWIMFSLSIDPYSQEGVDWLVAARRALEEQSEKDNYSYFLVGGNVAGHDTVDKVFECFPKVMGGIFIVVFLLVGLAYKSVLIPIRAIFTICATLILVYGLGVLTYEHGILEWTHFHGFINPQKGSLSWLVPAMIAPIALGLSLDYDIFLLQRIVEYREVGFKTYDSILCGIAQTGGVITAAGIVMTLSFGGLELSTNPALNQLSFFSRHLRTG
mmetsp:Transcript_37644/g.61267  ORF Transcript_37644/g.61267 Transcript_37644/m.61267 type:complete len:1013 (-) Transcript_37644:1174-4212(-)